MTTTMTTNDQKFDGGTLVAEVLQRQGVRFLFTLCGGHISPILVGAKRKGIRVVDVRHEVNAVFAADAVARLTGVPGVAAVTAGPGLTNTITAVKNAQMAQSPLVLLGGATATALRGRGALQDIDQMALFEPHVKQCFALTRVRDIVPAMQEAFRVALSGVPGPVFVELPVDLLYDESIIREWYGAKAEGGDSKGSKSMGDKALAWYLNRHVEQMFLGADEANASTAATAVGPIASASKVKKAAKILQKAERPVLVLGSQALADPRKADRLAAAVEKLNIPVWLSGMARGLLGKNHPLQRRHKRRLALKDADVVLLGGVPCDFRLDYGAHVRKSATLISVNKRSADLYRNRIPDLAVRGDPCAFFLALAEQVEPQPAWSDFASALKERDLAREAEIEINAQVVTEPTNPVAICRVVEAALADDSILVADGGDFVGTASYIVQPRGPLSWLDPGVFGTLGVGAGFALGAALVRPSAEVWIIYGDGSCGYSLSEYDTFVRHGIPVIAVVGNDACWTQIAREQIPLLGDDVGVMLSRTAYHKVVEGFGAKGFLIDDEKDAPAVFAAAKEASAAGHPVLVNVHIGTTDFRKGSISI